MKHELGRRAFLKGAGVCAAVGASAGAINLAGHQNALADHHAQAIGGGTYDFDAIYNRVGTNSVKWDRQIAKYGADNFKIGMGIADMDFKAPACIQEALEARTKHENWGYLDSTESLKEAICNWNKERYGIDVAQETVTIASGVHPGLIAALLAISPPASKVIMNTPTYNGFWTDLKWSRTVANENQLIKDKDGVYHIDWDDFEARLTPDTHAFLLCNPQNPTGNCWSENDLLRMGELCLKHGVTVLADEIHCDFVNKDQTYTPFASLPDKAIVDNSVTFKAVSKTFSLSGMKNAYFYSTNPVLLERVRYYHRANLNTLGIVANEAAYREGAPWFDALLPYIDANHDFVEQYLKRQCPDIRYKKAQGTYLTWLDMNDLIEGIDAKAKANQSGLKSPEHYMEQWLVERAQLQLNPGSNYGAGGEGHMRMNIATSRAVIKQAIDNLASAIKTA